MLVVNLPVLALPLLVIDIYAIWLGRRSNAAADRICRIAGSLGIASLVVATVAVFGLFSEIWVKSPNSWWGGTYFTAGWSALVCSSLALLAKRSALLPVAALLATASATFFAVFLVWRTEFFSQRTDVSSVAHECGVIAAVLAIAFAAFLPQARRTLRIAIYACAVVAASTIVGLHASKMACSMKKLDVCEPMFDYFLGRGS